MVCYLITTAGVYNDPLCMVSHNIIWFQWRKLFGTVVIVCLLFNLLEFEFLSTTTGCKVLLNEVWSTNVFPLEVVMVIQSFQ